MQINLSDLLQVALVILIIAGAVAVIQLIIILVDVRQVTKKLRGAVAAINLCECFFDGDEAKRFIKKVRKSIFGAIEMTFKFLKKLLGGEKNG